MSTPICVGVDVSSEHLDVAFGPRRQVRRFHNTAAGRGKLIGQLADLAVEVVLMEATGGWELALTEALYEASLPASGDQPPPGARLRPRDGDPGKDRCARCSGHRRICRDRSLPAVDSAQSPGLRNWPSWLAAACSWWSSAAPNRTAGSLSGTSTADRTLAAPLPALSAG